MYIRLKGPGKTPQPELLIPWFSKKKRERQRETDSMLAAADE
jgi:hypothetical protein